MVQAIFEVPEDGALTVRPARMSRHEYRKLCATNPDLHIERNADGEVVIMAPAHSRSGNRNARILHQLQSWAFTTNTGECYDSSAGFDLPNGANRSPDASWIRHDRLAALPPIDLEEFIPLCPDFVIEVRSHTDRLPVLQAKMQEYVENGAVLGWLIDPLTKRAWVYRPGGVAEMLQLPESLSADPELPGFTLHLDSIWNPKF